jgi:hypothetical protein
MAVARAAVARPDAPRAPTRARGRSRDVRATAAPRRPPRRREMAFALVGFQQLLNIDASFATTSARAPASTFSVETTAWTIGDVPAYYEGPIDLGTSASGEKYECLLRDGRFGMAGQTIALAAQTATSGGPRALKDIGDVDAIAERLVQGENAKSRGNAAAVVRGTSTRVDASGVEYYGVEYEKTVLGARRVVALTLALTLDATTGASTLYTLTIEQRAKDFDDDIEAMRGVGRAFRVAAR